jgi:hypothetical protein
LSFTICKRPWLLLGAFKNQQKYTTMSMNYFNPDNEWERSQLKHENQEEIWRILSNLFIVLIFAFVLFGIVNCATQKQQPCDVLFDEKTGEAIYIYDCNHSS